LFPARPARILLTGGGTGGHVYPLLAVVEALGASAEFHWLGSERSEAWIVPQFAIEHGIAIDFHQLDIRFSYRLPTPRNWGYYRRHILPLLAGRPFRQARAAIGELQPHLVLASGGYVAAPALWAARQHGIPYALVQLDGAVGLVNAHFAPGASRIYVSSLRAFRWLAAHVPEQRLLLSGFPARRVMQSRRGVFEHYGFDPARRLLVIMGGSLGAGAIAGLAAETISLLDESAYADSLAILFSAGERVDTAQAIRDKGTRRLQFTAVDYIGDSVSVLAAADFYLGRSGASTVAELVATGPHCLLIPDPQHPDRQQFHNAEVLALRGQGAVLEQRNASSAEVANWLKQVWGLSRTAVPPPAAELIARDVTETFLQDQG
jgi:UDP-N-acetylglucosamine--N-acetylmuramyl-(pentapeptide) pyrophosphoryl-undecaprenol N-acetylglucosamine transferase